MRWIVLLATFIFWMGCMAVVYVHCRPAQLGDVDTPSRKALDRLFGEEAPEQRAWNVYADPAELELIRSMLAGGHAPAPVPQRARRKMWTGFDEKGLVLAGRIDTRVKNRRPTSLDEETAISVKVPNSPLSVSYNGQAHLNSGRGLETCRMSLKLKFEAFELEALSSGIREDNELVVNTAIMSGEQKLYSGQRRENIGGNAALNAELAPFQFNPNVKVRQEWTVLTFDLNLALAGESRGVKPMTVRCDAIANVLMNGMVVKAYEVHDEDNTARAWYAPGGTVLKQSFKLGGLLDVMLVRVDMPPPAAESAK